MFCNVDKQTSLKNKVFSYSLDSKGEMLQKNRLKSASKWKGHVIVPTRCTPTNYKWGPITPLLGFFHPSYNDPGGPSCKRGPFVDGEVIGSMRLRETSQGRLRIQGGNPIRDGMNRPVTKISTGKLGGVHFHSENWGRFPC